MFTSAFHGGGVIDLPHRLVGLVGRVNKGQPDVLGLHVELGQDGMAKGLGRDTGAVGNKKYSAMGHDLRKKSGFSILQAQAVFWGGPRPTIVAI